MATVEVKSNRKIVEEELNDKLMQALTSCGIIAQAYAKKGCPVDTGNLRNSIDYDVENDSDSYTAYIGTNVEYARYQEEGTRSITGKHFLKNAASNHSSQYMQIIEEALKS